jgi:NAD(P)-dependent dehydrogenase (short-subunit alcohol dehydrogenase family)
MTDRGRKDEVLLITGGSRGIGAAVATSAAARGWTVCFTYQREAVLAEDLVAGIESRGGRASAVRADMTSEPDILHAFEVADGMGTLTRLVANVGIVDVHSRVDELTVERIERIMAVNVVAPIVCCREAVLRMSTKHGGEGGSIVLVSSVASRLGGANDYVDYAASKGAIDTLGHGLALEVASEAVRVNVVRPGLIDTDIHASGGQPDRAVRNAKFIPMGRAGSAGEVAEAVIWLLSDEASYCTGAILDVAGGR